MHRMVATVFRTIMISIVLIIVFEMSLYLIRVNAVVDRVESMMTTLLPEIAKNNYMTANAKKAYIGTGGTSSSVINDMLSKDGIKNGRADGMLQAVRINYGTDLGSGDDLSIPKQYGQTRTVVVEYDLRGLDFTVNHSGNATQWTRGTREFTMRITRVVPCLKYIRLQ